MILIMCMVVASLLTVKGITAKEPVDFYSLPGVYEKNYAKLGDINIGALVLTQEATAKACLETVRLPSYTVEQTEAVAFAVDYVNRHPDILPNVTIGFTVRGICKALGPILASSLLFLPQYKTPCRDVNTTLCTQQQRPTDSMCPGCDVIGLLATGWSSYTKPIASLYAVANVPLVGVTETNNDLSSKSTYPTFFRVVPPQKYQVNALLKFISTNGWSYVSIVYTNCGASLSDIIKNMEGYGICSAAVSQMKSSTDARGVVDDLVSYSKARVVLLFISTTFFQRILQLVSDRNLTGHFLWIGTNLFDSYSGYVLDNLSNDPALGTLFFDVYSRTVPEFYEYLNTVKASESNNPWVKATWEYHFNCTIHGNNSCASNDKILLSSEYRTYKGAPLRIDAVLTFAQAAHDLLQNECPLARGKEARACITSDLFIKYMKNVNFHGFVAPVKFDKRQDIQGRYSIKQMVYDYPVYNLPNVNASTKAIFGREVGIYDITNDVFTYHEGKLSWSHLSTLDRIVPWTTDSLSIEIPESVCSRPCLPGEYRIQKESSCCWECHRCRENERFINGNTSCEACLSFTWPDPASGFTTCIDLPLTYSTLPDTIPVVLTSLAVLALVGTAAISVTYFIYRNERVIKASSRELSGVQLVAIFIGYSTIVLFQAPPSNIMCAAIFAMFCMSFAMLYSPLLAKASRIFRIFKSGTKNERPRFISPQSQLIFSFSLITGQVVLCIGTYILYTPKALRIQPVWTEKLVELSCDLTLPGLASFLGYNIVLVSVCSVFAFLTRKLPDNFNESKFISMCVATTLLIWLAFIPTYFTASREFVRVFLLSVALFLNHSVALIFLFVPKLYAAIFLPSGEGPVSKVG